MLCEGTQAPSRLFYHPLLRICLHQIKRSGGHSKHKTIMSNLSGQPILYFINLVVSIAVLYRGVAVTFDFYFASAPVRITPPRVILIG